MRESAGAWTQRPTARRTCRVAAALFFFAAWVAPAFAARAADLDDALKLFQSGKYEECAEACADAVRRNRPDEGWPLLKIRAELATGKYAEAMATYESATARNDRSIPLLLLGYDVYRANNKPAEADEALLTIRSLAVRAPWRYSDTASRVALGRALLRSGADARQVLELFFDQAKKENPRSVEPYAASGELALEKHDYAVAAEAFAEAAKRSPDDPDIHYGLAQALHNDSERATAALNKALELNPRHADTLLFQADNLIDREDYAQAEALLAKVLEVNGKHFKAWAYRAVLAHLKGDKKQEEAHRGQALSPWETNPEMDHLIGQKLSQNYRFAEGAEYQRRALEMAANYRPAKVQLCQDLLRLGNEDDGWKLAAEVFAEDKYNVVAYNLVTLHESLSKFRTLRDDGRRFLLRMDAREADIYGQRALRLLTRAREKLATKYGVELADAVTVEIFPKQKDFAIRTFGLPGGDGFLGVCFGNVVTVNSPASRGGNPSNWEAVLWHEFCHVVTLGKTNNKMPRWLSEGISVYEERQEVPAWGQVMNPRYRELVLAGGATPVSKLSGAFLRPKTPMHLQFAYYESSMVVEYVIGRFGVDAIKNVLADLGKDVAINDALAKHTEPIEKLDASFEKWLREQAEGLAAGANWDKPDVDLDAGSAAVAAWNKAHPNSFFGLLSEGRALVAERKFEEAKAPLQKAAALYPGYREAGGPFVLLAAAHRGLGETEAERAALEKHVALDADAVEPRLRLMEIAAAAKDWKLVRREAEAALAVNPLVPGPHRYLALAAEGLGERPVAIEAHRTLLLLDPLDRAEHHFKIGRLLAEDQKHSEARREVVKALEEAPRYRDAHKLLLEIAKKTGPVEGPPEDDVPAPDAPAPDAAAH